MFYANSLTITFLYFAIITLPSFHEETGYKMAWVLACTKVQGRSSFVKRMNCFCAKLYNLTVRSVQKRSFFSHSISLLPKIVTEAHANLKKNKTSCNTTLSIMQSLSSTPLWNVRDFPV